MSKFNVGDRVRYIYGEFKGEERIIAEWDKSFAQGSDAYQFTNGRWNFGSDLELVKPSLTQQSPADYLNQAAEELADRASTYDNPEGERSMGATVDAFNAITGHSMTEEQGWVFMAILKAVRSQQGDFRADSYIDGAAYFALAAETACKVRG